jgi:hypothetical protein
MFDREDNMSQVNGGGGGINKERRFDTFSPGKKGMNSWGTGKFGLSPPQSEITPSQNQASGANVYPLPPYRTN